MIIGPALKQEIDEYISTLPKTLRLRNEVEMRPHNMGYDYSYGFRRFTAGTNSRDHAVEWKFQEIALKTGLYSVGASLKYANTSYAYEPLKGMFTGQLKYSCKARYPIVTLVPEHLVKHLQKGIQMVSVGIGYEEDRIWWMAQLQETLSSLRGVLIVHEHNRVVDSRNRSKNRPYGGWR